MAKIVLEFGRTPGGQLGFEGLVEFSGDAGADAVASRVTQEIEIILTAMGVRRELQGAQQKQQ